MVEDNPVFFIDEIIMNNFYVSLRVYKYFLRVQTHDRFELAESICA